jgi:hypothetical protein
MDLGEHLVLEGVVDTGDARRLHGRRRFYKRNTKLCHYGRNESIRAA